MSIILLESAKRIFSETEHLFAQTFSNNLNRVFLFGNRKLRMQNRNENKMDNFKKVDINEVKSKIREKYKVTFETTPTKSLSDKKEYLAMKLDNGLRVLLISDIENLITLSEIDYNDRTVKTEPKIISKSMTSSSVIPKHSIHSKSDNRNSNSTTKSIYAGYTFPNTTALNRTQSSKKEKLAACSLSVGVGSYSDPETIQGLAHFLEHMLFMGSEKFPKENDFDSFITTRGGSSNAFTYNEVTSFYFTCPEKHLHNIMDRFSNFFVSPLMNRDSISKEKEVVDSEFQQNLSSDSLRIEQLLFNTAPVNNPAHKFSWGNSITLKQNITEDVLHSSVKKFWKDHYSSGLMTVAIQSRLPLDVIGIWAAQFFSAVPSIKNPPPSFPYLDKPFTMDLFNKIYTAMPIEETNHLKLTWAFPSVKNLYKSKPLSYLSFLIDHKGEGSLFSYFHKNLWIIDLNAYANNEDNSIFSLFSIVFTLTEKGLRHYEHIIELVFSYIKLLKLNDPSESLFKESQIINELAFRFQHENDASENVLDLSENMQIYPPSDYITGDKLLFEFKPDDIKKILELMTPDNVNIMVLSKSAAKEATLDQTEQWFHTKYRTDSIPAEYLHKWRNCKLDPVLMFPKPNVYIPTVFDIIPHSIYTDAPEEPNEIIKNDCMEVWYKQDTKFKLPYGHVAIYLISPTASSFPQNSVMCDIFQWLFSYIIVKETYAASLGGLNYSLSSGFNGLILIIDGFSHKIPLLLKNVLEEMIKFAREKKIPQGLFEAVKEQLRKDYYNTILDVSSLSYELFLSIMCTHFWSSINELEAISQVTIEKCQELYSNFFENLYIKCLIQGNISEKEAVSMSQLILNIIHCKPLFIGTYPQVRTYELPLGNHIIRVQSLNDNDRNCNVTNYYQFGQCSMRDHCLMYILMLIMEEPLNNMLRTQEQLGYSVSCQFRDTQGILGFSITVSFQSDKFSVEHVDNRISFFLKTFKKFLEEMPPEDFNRAKESLRILLKTDDTNLHDEVQRNLGEIISDEYVFDRLSCQVGSIESIKLSDLTKTFNKLISNEDENNSGSTSRKLSIQVDAKRNPGIKTQIKEFLISRRNDSTINENGLLKIKVPDDKNLQHKFIKNIDKFKSSMFIFPYNRNLK